MAKSISGGLGTVNLTIGELRLLGATFDDFNSTNGTITGTLTVNNIIISGTVTLTDLELSGELTAPTINSTTITNTGTTTTNDLIINNEIQINQAQATASNDFKLMFLNASDYVRVSQTAEPLTFNPSSGLLQSSNLTLTDVFEIKQQTNPNDTLFKITETGTGVTFISGIDPPTNYNLGLWSDGHIRYVAKKFHKFYVDGVAIENEVFRVSSNFVQFFYNLSMEGNSRFRFTDTEPTVTGDKGILEWRQQQQGGTVTKVRLTGYQDANGDWELHFDIFGAGDRIKMTTTGVELYADNHGEDVECPIFFGEATTGSLYEISKDNTHLTYNPFTNKLTTDNIELSNDLIVTGGTTLGNTVSINALNSVIPNTTYPILLWNNTATIRTISQDLTNLYYDTSNNTLYTPNLSLSSSLSLSSLTVTGNTDLQGDTTITAVNSTVSNNNRIPFIEGGGGTGRLCESNLYYNPSNQTLVSSTVLGTTAVNSPQITIMGTNNGQLNIDPTYGMFFNHTDGYVLRMSGVWKLRIANLTTTIYNDLQLQSNLTVDGDITKDTATLSAAGRNMNILFHDNDAGDKRIKEHDLFHFNPSSETLSVTNMVVNDDVTLNNINTPTADTEFPFIIHNSGSGIVKITETNTSYNPVSNKLRVPLLEVDRIRHGGAVGKLDLNTIEIFIAGSNTSLYSSEDDNGANVGVWGYGFLSSPVFLKFKSNDASITRQRITDATRVSSIWNWETVLTGFPPNQTIDTTYFSKYFYMSSAGYNDTTWRMKTRVRIRNLSNNRIAPRMILRRTRGAANVYYDSSEFIHYIRTGLANFSTVECYHIIDDVQSTDEFYLILQVARGGASTFTSQLSSTEWEIQNFYQEFHYLGSQPRNNVINPSDPSIIQ